MQFLKRTYIIIFFICFSNSLYSQIWHDYIDSAKVYKKKNSRKYLEFYLMAKEELKKDSAFTKTYSDLCFDLGYLYSTINQYNEAKSNFEEARVIQKGKFGADDLGYTNTMYEFGSLYKKIGDYPNAISSWVEVKRLLKQTGKNDTAHARFFIKFGDLYTLTGKFIEADSCLQDAKQILEILKMQDSADYADLGSSFGNLYQNKGDLSEAETQFLSAVQIWEKIGIEDINYTNSLAELGILYRHKGQNEKAVPLVVKAMEICVKVKGKENRNYAGYCNSLAIIYKNMGLYSEAESQYREAKRIQLKVSGNDDLSYASTCNNLGLLYKDMGNYPEAEKLLKEAMGIREKKSKKNNPDLASSCFNLANLYQQMGNTSESVELYLKAMYLDSTSFGKESLQFATSCIGLAAFYQEMNKYDEAVALYQKAREIQISKLGNMHHIYASTCNGLGIVYEKMRNYKNAEQLYKEAKHIFLNTLGDKHFYYGSACANLANIYWVQGEANNADKEFKESFKVNTANLYAAFQFTNEKEKKAFIENVSGNDDKAYTFYLSQKMKSEQPYAISLFHRNLILSSLQALNEQVNAVDDSVLNIKYNEWMNLKKYLEILYSTPSIDRKDEPTNIQNKADQLEKEIVREFSAFNKQKQLKNIDWKDIQKNLKEDEASIEFVCFQYNPANQRSKKNADSILYAAILVRKEMHLPEMIYLFGENQLKNVIASSQNKDTKDVITSLYTFSPVEVPNKAAKNKSIYELIWKPLENEIKGINTIYFAPAGMLNNISFTALPVNDNTVLSDKYNLIQLTSTAYVMDKVETFIKAEDKMLLYGGVNYDANLNALQKVVEQNLIKKTRSRSITNNLTRILSAWSDLPETTEEVYKIADIGKILNFHIDPPVTGVYATEESIKELSGKKSPAVLHIATHGFFFPKITNENKDSLPLLSEKASVFRESEDPMLRSGLILAGANNLWKGKRLEGVEDGILTSYEVSNLYLPNTKLAVLSACETALGDIRGSEGVYGLQRAFKIAGVQNLVMSLWKVPSKETAEFMELFYQGIFENKSITKAFYEAQNSMKEKYRNNPYNWAAWILVK